MGKLGARRVVKSFVIPTMLNFGLATIEFFGMVAVVSNIDPEVNNKIAEFIDNHKIITKGLQGATALTMGGVNSILIDKLEEPINDTIDTVWSWFDMKKITRLYDKGWTNQQISVAVNLPERVVDIAVEEIERTRIARKGEHAELRPKYPEKDKTEEKKE